MVDQVLEIFLSSSENVVTTFTDAPNKRDAPEVLRYRKSAYQICYFRKTSFDCGLFGTLLLLYENTQWNRRKVEITAIMSVCQSLLSVRANGTAGDSQKLYQLSSLKHATVLRCKYWVPPEISVEEGWSRVQESHLLTFMHGHRRAYDTKTTLRWHGTRGHVHRLKDLVKRNA